MKTKIFPILALVSLLVSSLACAVGEPEPLPTSTPYPSLTPYPTYTPYPPPPSAEPSDAGDLIPVVQDREEFYPVLAGLLEEEGWTVSPKENYLLIDRDDYNKMSVWFYHPEEGINYLSIDITFAPKDEITKEQILDAITELNRVRRYVHAYYSENTNSVWFETTYVIGENLNVTEYLEFMHWYAALVRTDVLLSDNFPFKEILK